jgi:serine/threonine protein kinase
MIKGFAWMHEKCITHRDIKPSNIMVENPTKTKIIDFGLANSSDAAVGTPDYIDP